MVGSQFSGYRSIATLANWKGSGSVHPSSICRARQKIKPSFFWHLLNEASSIALDSIEGQYLWCGRPVYGIDGTKLNLPHELKASKYRGTHSGCYYPQGMLTTLVRLKTGIPCHFVFSRKTSEPMAVPRLLRHVPSDGIVVFDRLYFSGPALLAGQEAGLDTVFRVKSKCTLKEATDFIASGKREDIKRIVRKARGDRKALDVEVRFVRYKVGENVYILATTLLDQAKYPIPALKSLYHQRWGIEETFKCFKRKYRIENFHSRTPQGVKQEIGVGMLLTLMSQFLKLGTGRRSQANKAVSSDLLGVYIQTAWDPYDSDIVRTASLNYFIKCMMQYRCQSPPGRGFPRISRKVISRWQRSTAQEWDKARRQKLRAMPP